MIALVILNLLLVGCAYPTSSASTRFEISSEAKMVLSHEHVEEAAVPVEDVRWRNVAIEAFRYRECTKNQATAINLKAYDGCLEFMPAGEEGTIEAFICAACTCHRNFHRREPVAQNQTREMRPGVQYYHHNHYMTTPHPTHNVHHPPLHQPYASRHNLGPVVGPSSSGAGGSSMKRFRTKFTQDQKERMMAFSHNLGWRLKKQDEANVQEFCAETGIDKKVFKVWMQNNKHTLGNMH